MVTLCRVVTEEDKVKSATILRGEQEIPANRKWFELSRAAKGLLAIANLLKEIITAKWNIRIIGKKGISRELLSAIEADGY